MPTCSEDKWSHSIHEVAGHVYAGENGWRTAAAMKAFLGVLQINIRHSWHRPCQHHTLISSHVPAFLTLKFLLMWTNAHLEDVNHLSKLAQQKSVRHVNPVPCDMVASRSDVFSLRALVYSIEFDVSTERLKKRVVRGFLHVFYCFLPGFQDFVWMRFRRLLCSNSQWWSKA